MSVSITYSMGTWAGGGMLSMFSKITCSRKLKHENSLLYQSINSQYYWTLQHWTLNVQCCSMLCYVVTCYAT